MCTFVCKVHDDSPAQQAGLKVGEFVLFFFHLSCIEAWNKMENIRNRREGKWGKCQEVLVQLVLFCVDIRVLYVNKSSRPFREVQIWLCASSFSSRQTNNWVAISADMCLPAPLTNVPERAKQRRPLKCQFWKQVFIFLFGKRGSFHVGWILFFFFLKKFKKQTEP